STAAFIHILSILLRPPSSPLFPYTTLFRSPPVLPGKAVPGSGAVLPASAGARPLHSGLTALWQPPVCFPGPVCAPVHQTGCKTCPWPFCSWPAPRQVSCGSEFFLPVTSGQNAPRVQAAGCCLPELSLRLPVPVLPARPGTRCCLC